MTCAGKCVLVTGSAEGIGKAYVDVFLSEQAKVLICDINVTKGEETMKEFKYKYGSDRVDFQECDVTKETDIQAAFSAIEKQFGGFDILVNNAGILDEKQWGKMVEINMIAPIRSTEMAIDIMGKRKGGFIINTASVTGIAPVYNVPIYSATKHGLLAYTRACALNPQHTENGLSFASICPGFVNTQMLSAPLRDNIKYPLSDYWPWLYGTVEPSFIGEGLRLLLKDPSPNGAILVLSEKHGVKIKKPSATDSISAF